MNKTEAQFNNISPNPTKSSDNRGSESQPKQRYTIDVTQGAANEVTRIKKMFDLSITDVFKFSLSLMRIYVDAVSQKKEIHVVDPQNPGVMTIVKLPLFNDRTIEGGPP